MLLCVVVAVVLLFLRRWYCAVPYFLCCSFDGFVMVAILAGVESGGMRYPAEHYCDMVHCCTAFSEDSFDLVVAVCIAVIQMLTVEL